MFGHFYHEILRKIIVSFGTMFNGITIRHVTDNGASFSEMNVPLAYGPTQKFLARITQDPTLTKGVQISLPRMSFEFNGLTYDPTRKVTTTQTFLTSSPNSKTKTKKVYMPVPYNMNFELSIYTKLNDDMLQIVEQIIPYFQPSYNLTVNLLSEVNEKRDIPIVLENIEMQDDYEGDFTTRRALIYTLRFAAKTYLFGPVPDSSAVIKKAVVDYTMRPDMSREVRYTVVPRAVKDYTDDVKTNLAANIGLADTILAVDNASVISVGNYIDINEEEVYVTKVNTTDNKLTVERGKDGTTVKEHVKGSPLKLISAADNALIEVGDDFGFSGTTQTFGDGYVFSPSLGTDVT